MPSICFDDVVTLEPRLGEVARLLEEIHRDKRINFTTEADSVIYTYLERRLRQATQ
jgi:hypothetical protein